MKYNRFKSTILLIPLLFLIGCFSSSTAPKHGPESKKTYNFIKYTDISGETKSIEHLFVSDTDELINEVVVFFWSMHCGYSRNFISRIKKNFNRDNTGVKFLFVNLDDISELDKLKNFIIDNELQRYQHAFSGLRAYDDTYEGFGAPNFPVAYVLNPGMKVTGIYN